MTRKHDYPTRQSKYAFRVASHQDYIGLDYSSRCDRIFRHGLADSLPLLLHRILSTRDERPQG